MAEIKIKLEDKPNLMHLRQTNPEKFKEVLSTLIAVAEDAADSSRAIPWYEMPEMVTGTLSFKDIVPAIMAAMFEVEGLSPENFKVLGADLHPLSMFRRHDLKGGARYSKWKKHFGMNSEARVDAEAVTEVIRKLMYYAKYIDVETFGKAMMSMQLEAHKALPIPTVQKLPMYPALRYQQEKLGDLKVGQFWGDVGALYGGEASDLGSECPACQVGELRTIGSYKVCTHCNIGLKPV